MSDRKPSDISSDGEKFVCSECHWSSPVNDYTHNCLSFLKSELEAANARADAAEAMQAADLRDYKIQLAELKEQLRWMGEELIQRREGMAAIRETRGCGANRDGDCSSANCPQAYKYLSGCPLYDWDHDEEGNSVMRPIPPPTVEAEGG